MQSIYILDAQPVVQKFFKPHTQDFILFLDDSVSCPVSDNPHRTNKGHVSISAVCFDCQSFKGFFSDKDKKSIFCEGFFELLNAHTPSVRDYLENIEQPEENFWVT